MDRVAGIKHGGLRVVAVFEGAKGGLVLTTGFGLLAFIHRGLHGAAEELVRHLDLNPACITPASSSTPPPVSPTPSSGSWPLQRFFMP